MSINDATPADWDRLRKQAPAIDPTVDESMMKVYIDMSNEELTSYMFDDEEAAALALQEIDWSDEGSEEDVVNNPDHYNTGNVECIEAIEESMTPEAFRGYLKGNCMKYLWRMSYKGKAKEDTLKAQWYLNRLIETL